VITDNLGPSFGQTIASTLATTADRRIVLVRTRATAGGVGKAGHFCAEPPPDAAENIASKVAAALEASVKTLKAEGEAKLDLARQLATTVQALFHRTQGLQLYRDGSYNLCQALLNDTITKDKYVAELEELRKTARSLIEHELTLTGGLVGGPPPSERPTLEPNRAGERPAGSSAKSERLTALRLVEELKVVKEEGNANEAKVKLAQLHDVLGRNVNESDVKKRTLTDEDMRTVVDRVRPLAKKDQQKKLALPVDIKEFNRDQFEQLFF